MAELSASESGFGASEGVLALPGALSPEARALIEERLAQSTRSAYAEDWAHWEAWAARSHVRALPGEPEAVANYAAELAGRLAPATIARRLAAIADRHRQARLPSPTADPLVGALQAGIRRRQGLAPRRRKRAFDLDAVDAILRALPAGPAGVRDQALILLGIGGGFRRAELAAMRVGDLCIDGRGLRVRLSRSKTDPAGRGREVGLERLAGGEPDRCPVAAVERWLELIGAEPGAPAALFREVDRHGRHRPAGLLPQAVARIVQRAAARAGIDPASVGAHSLRSTLVTRAATEGATSLQVAAVTGHRDPRSLPGYDRASSLDRSLVRLVLCGRDQAQTTPGEGAGAPAGSFHKCLGGAAPDPTIRL